LKSDRQSSGEISAAPPSFNVTWKDPELQRTRQTLEPSPEDSFSMTRAQG
jgi:hypothetical protein